MKNTALAALVALLALPAAAQNATTRAAPPAAQAAAPQASEGKTPRERARLAKEQNKDAKCATGKQKKATAT